MTYAVVANINSSSSGASGATSTQSGTTFPTPIYLEDGLPGAPALAASNYTTNGVFFTPSGIGVATGGNQRAFVGNDGSTTISGQLNVLQALALSGALALGSGSTILNGTLTTPNGNVSAPPGSQYLSTAGGPNATLWVKETGLSNTGWTPITRPVLVATCSASLSPGACVSLSSASGGGYVAAQVNVATLGTTPAMGVILTADGQGNCTVSVSGLAAGVGSGLTPSATLYVGQNGYVSTTPPNVAPYYTQSLGVAINATDAVLTVLPPNLYVSG